mmetsp:Transcript_2613/g.7779  ORF Transcript_2613/g.7779 Transcript_2613/m.7779 type:complete len:276 (-) Transcript_2613:446-1273(-)
MHRRKSSFERVRHLHRQAEHVSAAQQPRLSLEKVFNGRLIGIQKRFIVCCGRVPFGPRGTIAGCCWRCRRHPMRLRFPGRHPRHGRLRWLHGVLLRRQQRGFWHGHCCNGHSNGGRHTHRSLPRHYDGNSPGVPRRGHKRLESQHFGAAVLCSQLAIAQQRLHVAPQPEVAGKLWGQQGGGTRTDGGWTCIVTVTVLVRTGEAVRCHRTRLIRLADGRFAGTTDAGRGSGTTAAAAGKRDACKVGCLCAAGDPHLDEVASRHPKRLEHCSWHSNF